MYPQKTDSGYSPDVKRAAGPDLFQTIDFRAWLRDWFLAQKAADHRYSHRVFARRAGIRSPSLLNEVIKGNRNLSQRTTEGFIRALGLKQDEASFFEALVQLDQAETAAAKNVAWERVSASRRFRQARPLDGSTVRYLSNWYIPATRELANRADFVDDPRWLARQLVPTITQSQARDALATLLELGMLLRHEDGRLRPTDVSVVTPHEVSGLAAHNYHREMIARASDSLEGVEPDERHLCAVTVGIPESLVPLLKEELNAFQERLLNLCDAQAESTERVYQINLQLFPLSRALES
jgi:uncharacterized protein (TIGR02147 family)